MNNLVDSLDVIYNNPFVFAPLIVNFYKNYNGTENDLLLSYLILPLVLNKDCLMKLNNIRSTSNIRFITANKQCMAGFSKRLHYYKELTNLCLQYAVDNSYIEIEDSKVRVIKCVRYTDRTIKAEFEVTSKLYKLFRGLDVVTIYRSFGIKEL